MRANALFTTDRVEQPRATVLSKRILFEAHRAVTPEAAVVRWPTPMIGRALYQRIEDVATDQPCVNIHPFFLNSPVSLSAHENGLYCRGGVAPNVNGSTKLLILGLYDKLVKNHSKPPSPKQRSDGT